MKELLEQMVRAIVDQQDKIELEETTNELGEIVLRLKVDQSDMGKLIGKDGQIIKAIRTIIRVPAIKQGKRVNLEIVEEEKPEKSAEEAVVEEVEKEPEQPVEETGRF